MGVTVSMCQWEGKSKQEEKSWGQVMVERLHVQGLQYSLGSWYMIEAVENKV